MNEQIKIFTDIYKQKLTAYKQISDSMEDLYREPITPSEIKHNIVMQHKIEQCNILKAEFGLVRLLAIKLFGPDVNVKFSEIGLEIL